MNVNDFVLATGFKWVVKADPEREITGGYIGDLLSWVMSGAQSGDAWITIMSNINTLAVASLTDVSCIILADNVLMEEDVLNMASQRGINILSSSENSYKSAIILSEKLK